MKTKPTPKPAETNEDLVNTTTAPPEPEIVILSRNLTLVRSRLKQCEEGLKVIDRERASVVEEQTHLNVSEGEIVSKLKAIIG